MDNILFSQHTQDNSIPVSLIAKQLIDDLDIIGAFKSLYHKYIDPNHASFMINISSQNREKLIISLDGAFFKRRYSYLDTNATTQKRNIVKQQEEQEPQTSSGIGMGMGRQPSLKLKKSFKMLSIAVGASQVESTLGNTKALIDVQYEENNQSVEWLLLRLFSEMDLAAVEVSKLMNDTFARFKYAPMDT